MRQTFKSIRVLLCVRTVSSVPIPGEILKTTVVFGLTFEEILALAAVPLVLVLPSTFLDFIPLWGTFLIIVIGTIGVLIVVFQTPPGQSPVEWFPAKVERWLKPNKYTLKPKDMTKYGKPEVNYLSVVHTADLIEDEENTELKPEEFRETVNHIRGAEKLDLPEWAQETDEPDGLLKKTVDKLTT